MSDSPQCGLVRIEDVGKTFTGRGGTTEAIGSLSLDVGEGEFVSVVGPSGCGKSTLLRLVAGLDEPTRGRITIDGIPAAEFPEPPGMAFQRPVLLPWRSVLDNVLLPAQVGPGRRGPGAGEARERAARLLERVGLAGFAGALPGELSGGMQQRVALCRALVAHPRLLLMDEPFAALDALTREELTLLLHGLWSENRITALFVTHGISEAVLLSTRVVVLSARPARIVDIVDIDLPRRRAPALMETRAFTSAAARIREAIYSRTA